MKVTDFLKRTGSFLLSGIKGAFEPSNLISNIVAEGVIELGEEVIDHFRDKWFENKLYRSAAKRFEALSKKYNATLLDGLYEDICSVEGARPGKLSQGKAYARLILSSMEKIDANAIAAFPSCKKLAQSDITEVVTALTELKELICEGFLQSMSAKEQAFVQVVAARVANEIGSTLNEAVASVSKSFYGSEFRPITECPNCGATDGFVYDGKKLTATCTHCETKICCGEKTDLALGFEQAMRGSLADMKRDLAALNEGVSKILVKLDEKQLNARNLLAQEASKEYPNYELIKQYAEELRLLAPDDRMAEYFIRAHLGSHNDACRFLETTVLDGVSEEHRAIVTRYAIGSVERSTEVSCVRVFIKNNFSNESEIYRTLHHELDSEAEKIDADIYDVERERDAFIMYKSEDLELVRRLVSFLEKRGLSCFYSERNLQHIHRKGNNRYNNKIAAAMEHCRVLVFVSTEHSRSTYGGHIEEMKGWMKKELNEAKAAILQRSGVAISSYSEVPAGMKKPRIEYFTGKRTGNYIQYIKQFFGDSVNGGTTMETVAEFIADSAPMDTAFLPLGGGMTAGGVPTKKTGVSKAEQKAQKKAEKQRQKLEKKEEKAERKRVSDQIIADYKRRRREAKERKKREKNEIVSVVYHGTGQERRVADVNPSPRRRVAEVKPPPPLSDDEFGDYIPEKKRGFWRSVGRVLAFPFVLIGRAYSWTYDALGNAKRYIFRNMSEVAERNCLDATKGAPVIMTVASFLSVAAATTYACLVPIKLGTLKGTLWLVLMLVAIAMLIFNLFVLAARKDIFKPKNPLCSTHENVAVRKKGEELAEQRSDVVAARVAAGITVFCGVVALIVYGIISLRDYYLEPHIAVIYFTAWIGGLGLISAIIYAFAVKGGVRASAFVMTVAVLIVSLLTIVNISSYSRIRFKAFDGVVSYEYAYTVKEDGSASIALQQCSEQVVIPEAANGKPVTAATTYNPLHPDKVKSISVPACVTDITDFDFRWFTSLETVELKGVTELTEYKLSGIKTLTTVRLDKVVNIGKGAFSGCTGLKEVYLPKGVYRIENYAFNGCTEVVVYCEDEKMPLTWGAYWDKSADGTPAVKEVIYGYKSE